MIKLNSDNFRKNGVMKGRKITCIKPVFGPKDCLTKVVTSVKGLGLKFLRYIAEYSHFQIKKGRALDKSPAFMS